LYAFPQRERRPDTDVAALGMAALSEFDTSLRIEHKLADLGLLIALRWLCWHGLSSTRWGN
jgi:hypothetical protein